MSAIRIRKTVDSDTLHLPELARFMGHSVDILIEDADQAQQAGPRITPGTGDWDRALAAVQTLQDYDYDAQHEQDSSDIRDAQERLP